MVKRAGAGGLALVPWGGGTAMAAGSAPERLDIVLGTRRMGRILEHEPADLVAIVEAGITLAQLNEALGHHGQMLPIDAPRSERATIGGILAANTSGPRRLTYGTSRAHLIGVRFVDPHGLEAFYHTQSRIRRSHQAAGLEKSVEPRSYRCFEILITRRIALFR